MARSVFDAPHFQTEEAAFAYVEAHLWPQGPVCPHCGSVDRIARLNGKTTRIGLHKCNACKGQFTVRQSSIFESSHLPLHLWLQVIHLVCASKKGMSTRQIQRMLQCSMKTAWFLTHRIREAMVSGDIGPFGAGGGDVEADETYIGRDPDEPHGSRMTNKMKVMSIIDRTSGQARSIVLDFVTTKTVTDAIVAHVSPEARLLTDQAPTYLKVGVQMADHQSVNHSRREYVRKDEVAVHTNTVEGYFSVFKRGMRGVYQHCSKKHLRRYMAEFDFRYSNRSAVGVEDTQRAQITLTGFAGKRLTYETVGRRAAGDHRIVW
jgi:transposase-like protein